MADLNKKRKYLGDDINAPFSDKKLKGDEGNEFEMHNLATAKKYNIGICVLPRVLIKIVVDYVDEDVMLDPSDVKVYVKLYEDNLDKVDWNCIYRNPSLLSDFYKKYLHKFTEEQLEGFCESGLSFEFIKHNIIDNISDEKEQNRLLRYCLDSNPNIPISFLEEIVHTMDDDIWHRLCFNSSGPLEFLGDNLENYSEYHICEFLAHYQGKNINLNFYERYVDKFNSEQRDNFYSFANIPIEFLESRLNKITEDEWGNLCENSNIPFRFFEKHIDKLDLPYLSVICKRNDISMDFINKFDLRRLKLIFRSDVDSNNIDQYLDEIGLPLVCKDNIPVAFFEKHLAKLTPKCWITICANSSIPIEFIDRHIDRIDKDGWRELCEKRKLPVWFIKKYLDKLEGRNTQEVPILNEKYWLNIFSKSDITPEYFEYCLENKYKGNKQDAWRCICENENIPRYYRKQAIKYTLTSILSC